MQTKTNLTSRRHKGRQGKKPRLIVIHTMEAGEGAQTAENVANYFKTVDASAHWCIDNDSRVRVVLDEDTAWCAPGANNDGLQIELAGYAKQTAADWADQYSIEMLEGAALSAAEWVTKYGIPIKKLTVAQVKSGHKGFAAHDDISKAYKQSTHWDPGPNFPWNYFLGRVAALVGGGVKGPEPVDQAPDPGYSNAGFSTAHIKETQSKLNKLGYNLDVDGRRGPATLAAIKDFQGKQGLTVDGLPGPQTQARLDAAIAGPTAPPAPSLNAGFSPDYIKDVQTKLNKLGYKLEVDGSRGPATQAAIRDFQSKNKLAIDASPGPATMERLNAAVAIPVPAERPNVTALQAAVRATVDNSWGPDTDNRIDAVRQSSGWGGERFPYGVKFAQNVIGTNADGDWGRNSVAAHDRTVAEIQRALASMGYNPGEIDGDWGPTTEQAYQAARAAARR